jgi:hypothetical protein
MTIINQATRATGAIKDDYATAVSAAAVAATGYATGMNSLESALEVDLNLGLYKVGVNGNGCTGNEIEETYCKKKNS